MKPNADDPYMMVEAELEGIDEPEPAAPIELIDLPEVDLYELPEGELGSTLQDLFGRFETVDEGACDHLLR